MTEKAQQLGNEQAFADECHIGLTKRELFAAMALQGLISCPMFNLTDDQREKNNTNPPLFFSEIAVKYAEALLEELSKTNDDE